MKKRWLSLAVAMLMVFAFIPQAALSVLAEEEIPLDGIEEGTQTDQNREETPADGNEEGLILLDEFSVDSIDEGLTIELEDSGLELDANGIVQDELPEDAVQSNDGVQYISRSWSGSEVVSETLECTGYSRIDDDTEDLSGWYVVDSSLELDEERLNVVGTANIILVDGARLYNEDGIRVSPGATLNIYGQSGDTGELYLDADTNDNAALGGNEGEGCGTINIYGGKVTADTKNLGEDAAGIGGGEDGSGGTINIYGGTVTGIGGSGSYNGGAGIGGGGAGSGGDITIYGGTVNAQGGANAAGIGGGDGGSSGNIAIYGGTVNATGGSTTGDGGAGIGGGNERSADNITIHGGNITANGGCDGAGIGGGDNGSGGTITINGGTITANGGDNGAGIGGGDGANSGTVIINDGDITAQGGEDAAGIGGGNGAVFSNITVQGGTVKATGGDYAAGIGGGNVNSDTPGSGTITISGGKVTAQGGKDGAGIGGGEDMTGGTINISGGTVEATGGSNELGNFYKSGGAGIGGGDDADGGTINISGGTVKATGGLTAAGIGAGDGCDGGNITISGGEITTTGGARAAGIGGGEGGDGGTINISGGTIDATGNKGGAGIGGGNSAEVSGGGSGSTITISGGTIRAVGVTDDKFCGAGIGNGSVGENATITLTYSEKNHFQLWASSFHTYSLDTSTTLTLEKPFKDWNKGIILPAKTYTGSELDNFGGRYIVPSYISAVFFNIDTRDARHLQVTTDKHSAQPGKQVTVQAVVDGDAYLPNLYVLEASSGSKLIKVPVKRVKAKTFKGTFTMPDCDVIVTGKVKEISGDTQEKQPSRITLKPKTAVYTGKTINIGKAKVIGSTGKVTYAYYSDAKCKKKVSKHVNAGTYYVKARVAADDQYKAATSKAVKLTIKKAPNPMTVSPMAQTYRKDALTKEKSFAIKVKNAKGKVTYKAHSTARKAGIKVTKKGIVTIPKNCKKGTYKIRVLANGTRNYKAKGYYVVITVK